ncbi:hypothetical protein GC170_10320 [bacterium]|nr:hypothetical protein [bacterium]
MTLRPLAAWLCLLGIQAAVAAQSPQNPSPMVEHVREHPRLEKSEPSGKRENLTLGKLFVPVAVERSPVSEPVPLVINFHCGDWIPELACSGLASPLPCVTIGLGAGSERYARPFREDPGLFAKLRDEAAKEIGRPVSKLILVGWSAGYGAIREALKNEALIGDIQAVILLDGLHTGYVGGKPGPKESSLETEPMQPFLSFARRAVAGQCKFVYLHSEIFPGTFASTTETADWLIRELGLKRVPVLKWGPMKTQMLGETEAGGLKIQAFAGNSAPDHVDLLHALPEVLHETIQSRESGVEVK